MNAERDEVEEAEDLGDAAKVKERNKRVAARNGRLVAQLRKIMETRDGREWMHFLVYERCNVDKKQFTGNSGTFYNNGALEIGQTIVRELKTFCFEQWAQMEREALER